VISTANTSIDSQISWKCRGKNSDDNAIKKTSSDNYVDWSWRSLSNVEWSKRSTVSNVEWSKRSSVKNIDKRWRSVSNVVKSKMRGASSVEKNSRNGETKIGEEQFLESLQP
jgi:hypothetical protein